jgi:hypothetical protein
MNLILPNGKIEGSYKPDKLFHSVSRNGWSRFKEIRYGNEIMLYFLFHKKWSLKIIHKNIGPYFMIEFRSEEENVYFKTKNYYTSLSKFRSIFSFRKLTFLRRINYLERCFLSNLLDNFFLNFQS